ncbi:MAG: Lrp/AsnC family transcriptional regulator [Candidatus Micrarchaeota archaeon]|nr:Lrp/AsnC family transcriptional regulator [Candidatus Micrarchaeota archaeon]
MLDSTDTEILRELSRNCRGSYRELASRLKIHPTTLISRMQKLEKSGVIVGYGAHLDLTKLGFEFLGVVQIKIAKGKLLEAQEKISKIRGVVAVYDVTGEYDSVALVAAKGREQFSGLLKSFLSIPFVEHTNTQVILKTVKETWQFEAV